MSGLLDLLFLALLFGPAAFIIVRDRSWGGGPAEKMTLQIGVLIWTVCGLGFMWMSQARAWDKFEQACEEFEEEITAQATTDDDWNSMFESDWWATCHPEDFYDRMEL